jgi:transposase
MTTKTKIKYNNLPVRVSRSDFNRYISPHLSRGRRGPKPKVSQYKIFNYMLYVLHTGIQWNQLKTYKREIHWSNVYKWHNRWSKDGSYDNLFMASVEDLHTKGKLDLSILHGDGSNTVAKKGDKELVTLGISTREEKKS